jgi:hypothetical protein
LPEQFTAALHFLMQGVADRHSEFARSIDALKRSKIPGLLGEGLASPVSTFFRHVYDPAEDLQEAEEEASPQPEEKIPLVKTNSAPTERPKISLESAKGPARKTSAGTPKTALPKKIAVESARRKNPGATEPPKIPLPKKTPESAAKRGARKTSAAEECAPAPIPKKTSAETPKRKTSAGKK